MKWNIGSKIGSSFAVSVGILILIGGTSYFSFAQVIDSTQEVERTHDVIEKHITLLSILKDAETGQRGYVITGKDSFLEPYQQARQQLSRELADIRALNLTTQQQQRIDRVDALIQDKFAEMQEIIDQRRSEGFAAAEEIIRAERGKQIMDDLRRIINEILDEEKRELARNNADQEEEIAGAELTIILGIAIAVILVAIIGYRLTRNIAGPLQDITGVAQRITSGDLQVALAPTSRSDEIGELIRSFTLMMQWLNDMAQAARRIAAGDLLAEVQPRSNEDMLGAAFATMRNGLRNSTEQILEAANVLAASTSEILASSTQLAATTSETATAVAETTTTVEEVKQAAQVSSQKARLLSDNAQKSAQTAQAGRQAVDDTIKGMQRIQEQMDSIAETVVQLSEQSQSIGEIVASVTDLAEQTNLLAVNAAIEAARAGEQGRAFAVVAQEVKSLADQSKQATTQVRGILNDIQKAISSAVMATEQGSKTVEAGMDQSEEASAAIRALTEAIETSAQAGIQIAASSQQQSVGMDQVASAMDNIKQASSQNVSGTKQTEVAARNLNEMGQKLKMLVAQYRL
jgi:methyl-accepting chemotaxis protein